MKRGPRKMTQQLSFEKANAQFPASNLQGRTAINP